MPTGVPCLFLPGFGARASAYAEGLPEGWEALQPPSPSLTDGSLDALSGWLVTELARHVGADHRIEDIAEGRTRREFEAATPGKALWRFSRSRPNWCSDRG